MKIELSNIFFAPIVKVKEIKVDIDDKSDIFSIITTSHLTTYFSDIIKIDMFYEKEINNEKMAISLNNKQKYYFQNSSEIDVGTLVVDKRQIISLIEFFTMNNIEIPNKEKISPKQLQKIFTRNREKIKAQNDSK